MKFFLLAILLFSCTSGFAQSPDTTIADHQGREHLYHINPWVTSAIILGGGAVDLLALRTVRFKAGITDAEFGALDPNSISAFDRWALHQSTTNYGSWENVATIVNATSVLLPLTLFFDHSIGKDWGTVLAMYVEVQSVSLSLYMASPLGPLFQSKFRPIVYYTNLTQAERANGNNRNSFYSGHVASVSTATFFMAKVYSDYHPEIGANKFWFYAAAAVPPLALGYIRMLGLHHFPSDILTGLGVGALCGILIPELHRISDKDLSFGVYSSPEATGMKMSVALK